jgi:hypothetical protein
MMKVFIDRTFCIGNPYYEKVDGEYRHAVSKRFKNGVPPKVVAISNGGFPDNSAFEAVSLWMKFYTKIFRMELIAEIYKAQAAVFALLKYGSKQYEPLVNDYKNLLHKAGQEIVTNLKLSPETKSLLEQEFMPAEDYFQLMNAMADMIPAHVKK